MKAETYRRKAEELREKAANTNPRFWRKIEAMEAEADRLEERAAEKEAEEAESESDEDEDWDDENDVSDWDDCDDDEDEEEDDGEEPDEDEIKDIIRNELDNPDEEIVDALYDFFDRTYNEDDDDEKSVEASLDCVRTYYSYIQDCFNEGHTLAYVVAMISSIPDEDQAYMEMDEGDILEDLESVFTARGFSDAAIEFMKSEFDSCFEACRPDDFISRIEIYDEAYSKGLDHYGDEEKARSFAEACYHGEKVPDLNDDFEEYLREYEPWVSDGGEDPFSSEETEYSAEDILSYYYENPSQKPSYTKSDPEFAMGPWTFTSKSYYDSQVEDIFFGGR